MLLHLLQAEFSSGLITAQNWSYTVPGIYVWPLIKAVLNWSSHTRSFVWHLFFFPSCKTDHTRPTNHQIIGERAKTCDHCPTRWRNGSVHPSRNGLHSLCVHCCLRNVTFISRKSLVPLAGARQRWLAGTSCCSLNSQVWQWDAALELRSRTRFLAGAR